ncbi:192_t:CDS:2, partial [Acaulospora colombiana]
PKNSILGRLWCKALIGLTVIFIAADVEVILHVEIDYLDYHLEHQTLAVQVTRKESARLKRFEKGYLDVREKLGVPVLDPTMASLMLLARADGYE